MGLLIRRVEWTGFRLPFVAPFATAHEVTTLREGIIVRLTTRTGVVGLGEASPVPAFGGRLVDTLDRLRHLLPHLVGLDLDQIDNLVGGLDVTEPGVAAVACAVDTALCDLRARADGVSVAQMLGGRADRPVSVNATVGVADTTGASTAAARAVEAGFSTIKLKTGVMGSHPAEVDRIGAVREAIGPSARLRLDANAAWDVDSAISIIRAAERYDLELVEQPVAAGDLAGMARVRANVATPIAGDEAVSILAQACKVIAAKAADILMVKPMLAGGLRPAMNIIKLARTAGLRAIVTTTIDSGIGVTAALHLATTLPEQDLACGLATGPLLAGDLLTQRLDVRAALMHLPAGPGLGVTLDEEQLARYGGKWQELGI